VFDAALVSTEFSAPESLERLSFNPRPFAMASRVPNGAKIFRINYAGKQDHFLSFEVRFRDKSQRVIRIKSVEMSQLSQLDRVSLSVPDGAFDAVLKTRELPGIWRSHEAISFGVPNEVRVQHPGLSMFRPVCELIDDGCEIRGVLEAYPRNSKSPVRIHYHERYSREKCMAMFHGESIVKIVESPIAEMKPVVLVVLPVVQITGDWREPFVGWEEDAPDRFSQDIKISAPQRPNTSFRFESKPPRVVEFSVKESRSELAPSFQGWTLPDDLEAPENSSIFAFAHWLAKSQKPETANMAAHQKQFKVHTPAELNNRNWVRVRYPEIQVVGQRKITPSAPINVTFNEAEAQRGILTWVDGQGAPQEYIPEGKFNL
jgi:hypothetical protein